MILLSPAQTFEYIKPQGSVFRGMLFTLSPKRKRLNKVLHDMSSRPQALDQAFVEQFFLATNMKKRKATVLKMKPYTEAELKELRMPVLILVGDQDMINDGSSIERAAKTLSNGRGEIIPDAGHFLSVDQANLVNNKMLEFLDSE